MYTHIIACIFLNIANLYRKTRGRNFFEFLTRELPSIFRDICLQLKSIIIFTCIINIIYNKHFIYIYSVNE